MQTGPGGTNRTTGLESWTGYPSAVMIPATIISEEKRLGGRKKFYQDIEEITAPQCVQD